MGFVATVAGMQELAHYWEKEYDWRKAEAHINSFANYEMDVNGIGVGCSDSPCLLRHLLGVNAALLVTQMNETGVPY